MPNYRLHTVVVTVFFVVAGIAGCTVHPCFNDACEETTAELSGDLSQDLQGQWFSEDMGASHVWEFRADNTAVSTITCDNGNYVRPGEQSTFQWSIEDGMVETNGGERYFEVEVLDETSLVLEATDDDTTRTFERVECEGDKFEI